MGRERYRCLCGRRYLTGATEWDHLGDWERKRRVREVLILGVLFSAVLLVPCLVAYFALRRSRLALITAAIITVLPFSFIIVSFSLEVAASMWRTRIGRDSNRAVA